MAIVLVICVSVLVLFALGVWNNYLQAKARTGNGSNPSSALDE